MDRRGLSRAVVHFYRASTIGARRTIGLTGRSFSRKLSR
jgi:hypothetical protein